jgi:hypothetical protein
MADQTFEMTEEEFTDGDLNHEGRCLACGFEAEMCEPDARQYKCDNCGEHQVYGLAELLIMGKIEIVG